MANIVKKGKGFLCRINNGKDSTGKRIVFTEMYYPSAKSETAQKKEAQRHADELERKIKSGELVNIEKLTLNDFFRQWEKDIAANYLTVSKQEQYSDIMRRRFLNKIGNINIANINALLLQKIVTEMDKTEGLMPSTIRSYFTVLSSVMHQAYNMGIIKENPVMRVSFPKVEKDTEIHTFTAEQAIVFIKALNDEYVTGHKEHCRTLKTTGEQYRVHSYVQSITIGTMWKCFFILAIFSGMRRGEIVALTWDDIDFQNMSVSVTKSTAITKDGQIVKEPKTKAGYREIILPLPVVAKLKEWRKEQERYADQIGDEWAGNRGAQFNQNFIFTQANGKQADLHTPTHKFKEIIKLHNDCSQESEKLPEIRLHDLRHCTASLLISSGADIATVSRMLGHSKISMTLDRYTHSTKNNAGISDYLADLLIHESENEDEAVYMA